MNLDPLIRAVQQELGVTVDGKAGPETWGAIYQRVVPAKPGSGATPAHPPGSGDTADARSETVISTLHPVVRPYARALVLKGAAAGVTLKIISGLRTDAEQNALYAQGRTTPGAKVTNARAGHSNHNFGIAFDVGIFSGGRYVADSPTYRAVGMLGIGLGLEWGGSWTTLGDESHFQLRPLWAAGMRQRAMLAELRARKAAARDFFT